MGNDDLFPSSSSRFFLNRRRHDGCISFRWALNYQPSKSTWLSWELWNGSCHYSSLLVLFMVCVVQIWWWPRTMNNWSWIPDVGLSGPG